MEHVEYEAIQCRSQAITQPSYSSYDPLGNSYMRIERREPVFSEKHLEIRDLQYFPTNCDPLLSWNKYD